ncbi:MAG: PhzF family phenazine biosynthesis protein [Pseudomonadota bacterium]
MTYDFDWVDAFAERPFAGNACCVVHGADDLDLATRCALVRETSLSECAYLVASDVADFGARYYLADREIPMAGHPTVATVVSLVSRGMVTLQDGRADFTLEVGSGVLPIVVTEAAWGGVTVEMTQARPRFGAYQDPGEVAAIYGLSADDVVGRPRIVSTGSAFCTTVLRSVAALERARLDVAALQAWRASTGEAGAAIMEPFLSVIGGGEAGTAEGCDVVSRLLLPPPLPAEDPFTGSATGCLGAYLWSEGLIERPRFVAGQGDGLGRPGRAQVEALGPRDDVSGVKVAGSGVVLMSGTLRL